MLTAIVAAVHVATRALRRQPEALFLSLLCLLSGLVHFFGAPTPNPIELLIPPLMVAVWYAQLSLGGALRITGLLAASPKLDLAGCLLLGSASTVYGAAIVYVDGPGYLVAAAITLAFAAACLASAAAYLADLVRSRGKGPGL